LPQVVGYTKNETLISHFKKKIAQGETISLWTQSKRNLIDADDVFKIVDYCITHKLFENSVTNIATPIFITPLEIISCIEELIQKKILYEVVDKGGCYDIDISNITPHFEPAGVIFDKEYPFRVLQKYHSTRES
jgi:nucleoside-diphosphate-sugar epimerase